MTSTTSPRRANARRLILLVVVTAAVVAAQMWYGNRHHFLDLRIYVNAVRWWASGHPLYEFAHDDAIQGRLLGDLVDKAFGGSAGNLVLRALAERPTDPAEIAEIRALLDQMLQGKRPS